MLSGPAALEGLADLMASLVCSVVKVAASSNLFFLICFDITLENLELLCLTTEEYCSLKAEDMLPGEDSIFPLNLMVSFGEASFLPFRFLTSLSNLEHQMLF